jgi:phospho-N-acetylmuramoyl-pentapeptide-transferase
MLYYLFQYLNEIDFPGAGLFGYVSFRAALATLISLIIAWMFGGRIIRLLRKQQVGETIRD